MARYWVGESGERGAPSADPADVHSGHPAIPEQRERITDAVRRALAGNVQADDAD